MRVFAIAVAVTCASHAVAHADGVGLIAVGGRGAQAAVRDAIAEGAPKPARIVPDAIAEARSAVAAGAVPVATLERFRRVREQIDDGWRAFVRVDADFAASRLAGARTDAEPLLALPGGAALYADASLRLGAVLGNLGRPDEAQAALALAVALDPDRPITLAEFSPDIVAAVDAVRAQTRPTRTVQITAEPAGAAIAVDGKDIGVAPLSLDLALGQHVVTARMPQFEPAARAFAVDASTASIAVELPRDPRWTRLAAGASVGLAAAPAQELVDAAVRYADLDDVVLVAAVHRRGGPALVVQRCAGLPATCTAVVDVGYADASGIASAAREAWQTVRSADLRYPPSVFADAEDTQKPVDDRCHWCRSPILWGSVGAAALVGTIVIIAVVSGSRPPPTVGVSPGDF